MNAKLNYWITYEKVYRIGRDIYQGVIHGLASFLKFLFKTNNQNILCLEFELYISEYFGHIILVIISLVIPSLM